MKFDSLEKGKKENKEQNQNEIVECKQKNQFDVDTEIYQKINIQNKKLEKLLVKQIVNEICEFAI